MCAPGGGEARLTMLTALFLAAFPLALLALPLLMERVERPLRPDPAAEALVEFLETARPDEVETYVREGFGPALDRYWRRRRLARRLPGRTGRSGQGAAPPLTSGARR